VVLYARADVTYVCVPAESGGCGQPHRRPVIDGAPAQQFKLVCTGCENYLRADIARSGGNKKVRTVNGDYGLAMKERYLGLWGATPDTIPEAPDEELKREHDEQSMITKNAASQTETLAQIGAAVAGNAELMGKFIELQLALAAKENGTAAPVAVTGISGDGPVSTLEDSAETRYCLDCNKAIVRQPGQKGALPWRCPEHKAKKNAQHARKAA